MTNARWALSLVVALALSGCGTSSPSVDAATPHDAAGHDAGQDGGPVDSGPPGAGCATTFSSCAALEDHTGEASVTLAFSGFAYAPHCIRVSAGTVVTIPGSSLHPLRSASCSSPDSPLPTTPTSSDGDYTFSSAGSYGYFCNNHGTDSGGGMAGLIIVE